MMMSASSSNTTEGTSCSPSSASGPMPVQTSEISPADNSSQTGNSLRASDGTSEQSSASFKKPVLMLGPRPGFKKTDKRVKDALEGVGVEKKRTVPPPSCDKEPVSDTPKDDDDVENPSSSTLSPAERLKQNRQSVPYKEPPWGGICEKDGYRFEVLKTGVIIDEIDLTTRSFYIFGRLPSCDVTMEHPSLSRYHAIVQYCSEKTALHDVGWYLYDLDSTHGTWLNKSKVKPRVYCRLRVGHVVKFGGSTRLHILQGPDEDREEEADLSITEMKEQREKLKKEAELLRQAEIEERERKETIIAQDTSCSWGIDMDDAEEVESENPYSFENPQNEELYIEDPKKALRGYFEREGFDIPQYEFIEAGFGKHHCKVELPLDSPTGEPIFAEAVVSGKRKEAVVACALEACRILDRMGELRKATHESHKRKSRNWEEDDFYDSDEDTFLDRTGTIEKKRMERMKRAGKQETQVDTYDTLVEKLRAIQSEIISLEAQLEKAKQESMDLDEYDMDDLDAYMSSIKSGAMDKKTRMKLKARLFELRQDEGKVMRLVNVAKPAALPELKREQPKEGGHPVTGTQPSTESKKATMPMFGKMKKPSGPRRIGPAGIPKAAAQQEDSSDDEENIVEEEEEEEEEMEEVVKRCRINSDTVMTEIHSTPSSEDHKESKPDKTQILSNKRHISSVKQEKKKAKLPKVSEDYDPADPDYAAWLPPKDQTGDGRTRLNEKYGY